MTKGGKRAPVTLRPARNAPCPCGSGRAFKNCCAGKGKRKRKEEQESTWLHLVLIATIVLLVIGGMVVASLRPDPVDAGGQPAAAGEQPEPWEYDAANDRYWNPEHGHWHDGPPPAGRE